MNFYIFVNVVRVFHLLSMISHVSVIMRRKSEPVTASEVLSVPERPILPYI